MGNQASANISHCTTKLSMYKAACKADRKLQSFDLSVHSRTNHVISTLATRVEVRALSFDSLKEVTECLLEINQEVVRVTLECKKETRKNHELFELVDDYFKNNLKTLDFYATLEKGLGRTRDSQLLILLALQQFEDEGHNQHEKTLAELKNFKEVGSPFDEEFFKILESVYKQQMFMLEKLQLRKNKLRKKIKYIHSWRKLSSVIFIATFATVMSSMQACTYVSIKAPDIIKDLIGRLEIEIDEMIKSKDFSSEKAVKIRIDDIRKKLGVFMKNVEELTLKVDLCSRNIKMVRTVILKGSSSRDNHGGFGSNT